MTFLDHPFHFDDRGRTAEATAEKHVHDLIEQVLFTSPGERVNRPDFGTGLLQLVFAPNSSELAATVELLVQGSLQQWLGDVVDVGAIEVMNEGETLTVTVRYVLRLTQEPRVAQFRRSAP